MTEFTHILNAIDQGDPNAADQLLPLVYEELRRLAAQRLAHEAPGQTLQATALVHEGYLRLVGTEPAQRWTSRGHFFAAAAEAMRPPLRPCGAFSSSRPAARNGSATAAAASASISRRPASWRNSTCDDLLAIDEALSRLAARDPVRAELVKLRFFAGLTMPEAAQALGISLATAERYWTFARTWLYTELQPHVEPSGAENLPQE